MGNIRSAHAHSRGPNASVAGGHSVDLGVRHAEYLLDERLVAFARYGSVVRRAGHADVGQHRESAAPWS